MSSEQPGGDGHALSPGPARRAARAEPPGPPPLGPRPLTWGPRLPGTLRRDREAGTQRKNRSAQPGRRGGVWRRLDWLRQPSPRRLPCSSQTQNPFKPALTKGSKKPVTPETAPVHVTSSVQPGFQGSSGEAGCGSKGSQGAGCLSEMLECGL